MISEVDLASEAVAFFHSDGYTTYHEVGLEGRTADIVATRPRDGGGTDLVEIETKLHLGFEVLEQARLWRSYSNAVWIAVPWAQETAARRLAFRTAEQFLKMGVVEFGNGKPTIRAPAPFLSRMHDGLLDALRPEHKTFARPGSPSGGEFTAQKTTHRNLAAYVAANPMCTMEEAVSSIGHHYRLQATAVAQLLKLAKRGEIPGVHVGWKSRLSSGPMFGEKDRGGA